MKRKESVFITVIFSALLLAFALMTVFAPKKTFSQWENRNLESFPKITKETLLSGEFGESFDKYLSDHFAFRDTWLKLHSLSNTAFFNREINGVVVGKNVLFDIPDIQGSEEKVQKSIKHMNTFAEKYPDKAVSAILVPSSSALFPDNLPFAAPDYKEKDFIDSVYSSLSGIDTVNAFTLSEMPLEQAFYKTDHHWTSRGAAKIYEVWQNKNCGFEFSTVSEDFSGTLSSRSGNVFVSPDKIEKVLSGDGFVKCDVFNGDTVSSYESMYFDSFLGVKDKYSYFLGENQPLITLETQNDTGRVLLIFKDSFAHSFAQCCAEDFDKVILVDLRYLKGNLSTHVDMNEITDVLFLYSTESFAQSNMLFINR